MQTEFYLGLRKKAEELYPSDEKKSNEFVEGFISKVANMLTDKLDQDSMVGNFLGRGLAQNVGKAIAGGVVGAGFASLMGAVNVVKSHALYNKFLQALDEASKTNAVLRASDKRKLVNFGNTIFKFAPHVATDSNMLAHVLSNAIHSDSLDAMTIRMLGDLESRYQTNRGESNFNPKMWV